MSVLRSIPTCVSADDLPPIPREPTAWLGPRGQIVFGTCACAAASLFVYSVDPSRNAVYPECLLYNVTGYYCAGCGATRALYALLHGRLLLALHDNALFVAALPIVLYVMTAHALAAWRANAWPKFYLQPGRVIFSSVGLFALFMAFMIVRNLPGATFDWLRPLP
jgi:hypothetical protein